MQVSIYIYYLYLSVTMKKFSRTLEILRMALMTNMTIPMKLIPINTWHYFKQYN